MVAANTGAHCAPTVLPDAAITAAMVSSVGSALQSAHTSADRDTTSSSFSAALRSAKADISIVTNRSI